LSSLVRVTYYDQGDGAVNVFVGNGQSLVIGGKAASLGVGLNATSPVIYYYSDGSRQDVTNQMTGGRLGGLVQFRGQVLDASMARLDQIAVDLANAVNTQHASGEDLNGAAGGAFFSVTQGASDIQVSLGDANLVAAAQPGGGGSDNRNALALAALQREKLALGGAATVQGAYAQIVAEVGSRTRTAELDATAQQGLLMRAEEAHSAVSGVNLDEEAAKLMHYQQAYQAAAQAIAIAQTLFEAVMNAMRR
jgi:flagellar hook-associated protein 1 FlgK